MTNANRITSQCNLCVLVAPMLRTSCPWVHKRRDSPAMPIARLISNYTHVLQQRWHQKSKAKIISCICRCFCESAFSLLTCPDKPIARLKMANDINTLTRKFKILNIRRKGPSSNRAHLLGLPQELRDAIYELVIVEPSLFLRQHKPGCPRINALHGAETPICKSTVEMFDRGFGPQDDRAKCVACQKICQGRPGLTLLRVNKQIHREARQTFLAKNIFCFVSIVAFNKTLENIAPSDLGLIRRLDIMHDSTELRARFWASTRISVMEEAELWNSLQCLTGLVELSLPAPVLVWSFDDDLLEMKTLRHLRTTFFTHVIGWHNHMSIRGAREMIYMILRQDIELPWCFLRDEHAGKQTCMRCWSHLTKQHRELRHNFYNDIRSIHRDPEPLAERCLRVASRRLIKSDIVSPEGQPLDVTLELDDGMSQEVTFLGLPRYDAQTRDRLEMEEEFRARRAKASNARKVRSQPGQESALAYLELLDENAGRRTRPSKVKSPSPARRLSRERSRDEIAAQRAERHRQVAEAEEVSRRRVEARAQASVSKSVEAQVASKKAARKRSGRR